MAKKTKAASPSKIDHMKIMRYGWLWWEGSGEARGGGDDGGEVGKDIFTIGFGIVSSDIATH